MGLHAEPPFRLSQAVRDSPPLDGVRAVFRSKQKLFKARSSNRSGRLPVAATRIFSSCPRVTASAARFTDANPVTTLAGAGSLPFVSIALRNPISCKDCRTSSNHHSGSEHVHCLCHADDGASTTRSGRCQNQLEALGSGRVSPPTIPRSERNRHDAQPKGGTAQYD